MKILIATDSMNIGGAETHVFTLINELKKKDYNITLISAGGVFAKILEKSGLRCVNAPFNKRDPISVKKSMRILKNEMKRADIVHTHTRFTSFLAKKIRGSSSYPKIVTTAHLNFPLFPFGTFAFWGDGTLAVSEDIRNYLVKNYKIQENNIQLTKNSIDTSLYKKSNLDKKLIIHTSRIDSDRSKTAFLLIDIAGELLNMHTGWRIMIVGDGNLFSKLSKKASLVNQKLGFEGIILTGARSDIPSLLRYGSIFVGVSRSALEGMAAGLPTIICGDQGYGGIVDNDNFGLLSSSNFCARGLSMPTKSDLIKDIDFLIKAPLIRKTLGEFARKSIEDFYPSENLAKDAIACYNSTFKPPSVCLMGYFGYKNLGDEETLKSAVKALVDIGINDISLLSASRYNSASFRGKIYDRMNPMDIISAVNSNDIFIMCGGNLMQNETSTRSLIYYEQIIKLAKRRGKRVYMLSSGFGEIHGHLASLLLSKGIKSCDFCGCRTTEDLKIAKKYNNNVRIMPDLCFLINDSPKSKERNKTFVWILSNKSSISIDDILHIAKERFLVPIAVNMFEDSDLYAATNARSNNITVITPKSYQQLFEILSKSDFSISERLHGAIFSIISHTPTYLTNNSSKNRALLNEIFSRTEQNSIIHPYSKNDVLRKKEIGACDSDFNYVVNSFKLDILQALNEIF